MLCTKIQHFLCFPNATDSRTCNAPAFGDNAECGKIDRFWRGAYEYQRAISCQQGKVSIKIMLGRYRIDNKVEIIRIFFQYFCIRGQGKLVGSQSFCILFFGGRRAEHGDFGAKGYAQLYGHMPQAAQSEDSELMSSSDLPFLQGRPGRDPCT